VIAVDTSALMAILLNEPLADDCDAALKASERTLISAGTLTETLIVAGGRGLGDQMQDLVEGLRFEIVPVDGEAARRAAAAHARWAGARRPRASISAIASLTTWRNKTAARFSMSVAISRRQT
jgi:ribonuclease VapC